MGATCTAAAAITEGSTTATRGLLAGQTPQLRHRTQAAAPAAVHTSSRHGTNAARQRKSNRKQGAPRAEHVAASHRKLHGPHQPSQPNSERGWFPEPATLVEKPSGRHHDEASREPQVSGFRLARKKPEHFSCARPPQAEDRNPHPERSVVTAALRLVCPRLRPPGL